MKERLVSLLLACAALLLFWVLFFPKPGASAAQGSKPVTHDSGSAGYLGLWRWLQAAHLPLVQLRQPYEQLLHRETVRQSHGNVLILTLPFQRAPDNSEWVQLDSWIERGNTIVVLAALDDTPNWTQSIGAFAEYQIRRLTRLHFEPVAEPLGTQRSLQALIAPTHPDLLPSGHQPLFEGVRTLATASDLGASRWLPTPQDSAPLLELAQRADTHEPALWLKGQGQGRMLISAYADLFSNQQLGTADNARWLSNLLAAYLGPGGSIIFDDAHQGVVDYYDPGAFFADPRLHHTLLWLLLLWLLFVLGAQRLRASGELRRPVDDTAMLEASAGFLANMLSTAATARRLLELFFNRLRQRLARPANGQPVWDWLEAHGRVRPQELDELKRIYQRACADERIDLVRLQSLLSQLAGSTS
jgi:hypothetical protein